MNCRRNTTQRYDRSYPGGAAHGSADICSDGGTDANGDAAAGGDGDDESRRFLHVFLIFLIFFMASLNSEGKHNTKNINIAS